MCDTKEFNGFDESEIRSFSELGMTYKAYATDIQRTTGVGLDGSDEGNEKNCCTMFSDHLKSMLNNNLLTPENKGMYLKKLKVVVNYQGIIDGYSKKNDATYPMTNFSSTWWITEEKLKNIINVTGATTEELSEQYKTGVLQGNERATAYQNFSKKSGLDNQENLGKNYIYTNLSK